MIQLKRESIQAINVTVRDTTGYITDLTGTRAWYEVWSVDPDTDANLAQLISGIEVTPSGLNIPCILNPEYTFNIQGVAGWGIAQNPPTFTLPLTVTAGVNDNFNIVSILFGANTVPPGTYATYTAVANAMTAALSQFSDGYGSYYYAIGDMLGNFSYDSNLGKFRFDGLAGPFTVGTDDALNGLTIANGSSHDFLSGTGWGNGQIFFDNAVSPSGAGAAPYTSVADHQLPAGRYRLYVNFETIHAQVPRLGPVEFFIY